VLPLEDQKKRGIESLPHEQGRIWVILEALQQKQVSDNTCYNSGKLSLDR